jgi:hypothetical protein
MEAANSRVPNGKVDDIIIWLNILSICDTDGHCYSVC